MGFVGIYTALFDYSPQGVGELTLHAGDLLYVQDTSADDGWWVAKKSAASDPDTGQEVHGLIPHNYVKHASPKYRVKALYDYTRQTDEELSFTEDSILDVYDTSDAEWTLVGFKSEFGFVPANYVEELPSPNSPLATIIPTSTTFNTIRSSNGNSDSNLASATPLPSSTTSSPSRPHNTSSPAIVSPTSSPSPDSQSPIASLASILARQTSTDDNPKTKSNLPWQTSPSETPTTTISSPVKSVKSPIKELTSHTSRAVRFANRAVSRSSSIKADTPDSNSPQLALRQYANRTNSPNTDSHSSTNSPSPSVPAVLSENNYSWRGFKIFSIHQVKDAITRKHKLPIALGINVIESEIMTADLSSPHNKERIWNGSQMVNYSCEGKHVFIELLKPSESYDLHAGNKETAEEITSMLGEISGASRLGGMSEVLLAAQGSRCSIRGIIKVAYEAKDNEEISVTTGEEVAILDTESNTKSDWARVRNLRTGNEGLIPTSNIEYVEASQTDSSRRTYNEKSSRTGSQCGDLSDGRRRRENSTSDNAINMNPPQRRSSLAKYDVSSYRRYPRRQGSYGQYEAPTGSTRTNDKPNADKVRIWTDRSGSFKVEAQFLGLHEGKIHLHKVNGVRIAVPLSKMALSDIEYVERLTGITVTNVISSSAASTSSQPSTVVVNNSAKPSAVPKPSTIPKPLHKVSTSSHVYPVRNDSTSIHPSVHQSLGKPINESRKESFDWFDFFLECGVQPQLCERYRQTFCRDHVAVENLGDIGADSLRSLGVKEGDVLRIMKHLDTKFGRDNNKVSEVCTTEREAANSATTNSTLVVDRTTVNRFDDDAWTVRESSVPTTKMGAAPGVSSSQTNSVQLTPSTLTDLSMLQQPLQPTRHKSLAPGTPVTSVSTAFNPSLVSTQHAEASDLVSAVHGLNGGVNSITIPTSNSGSGPVVAQLRPPAASSVIWLSKLQAAPASTSLQRPTPPPPLPLQSTTTMTMQIPVNMGSISTKPVIYPQITGRFNGGNTPDAFVEVNSQKLAGLNLTTKSQLVQPTINSSLPYVQRQTDYNSVVLSNVPSLTQGTGNPGSVLGQSQTTGFVATNITSGGSSGGSFTTGPAVNSFFNSSQNPAIASMNTSTTGMTMGVNAYLPPALVPQKTGYPVTGESNFVTGNNGIISTSGTSGLTQPGFSQSASAPLRNFSSLQTGPMGNSSIFLSTPKFIPNTVPVPPPPVKFGVDSDKLVPQTTGRRANLSNATPSNPFGF